MNADDLVERLRIEADRDDDIPGLLREAADELERFMAHLPLQRMSRRDYFVAAALGGVMTRNQLDVTGNIRTAIDYADRLLEALSP